MTDFSNWHTHIHLVLPRADGTILMVPDGDTWALPSIEAERRIWWRSAFEVDRLLQTELGPGLLSLRCLSRDDTATASHIYVAEDLDGSFSPSGHAWINGDTLGDVALTIPGHRSVISAVLDELRSGLRPGRAPWWKPGWFASARQWLERWVVESGEVLFEPIERYYNWPLSSIVRAHTHSDIFYLKATTRLLGMADEPDLTARLAAMFPGRVPEPLAVDRERGWLLLRRFGDTIRTVADDVKLAALLEFTQMQLQSIQHIEELLEAGCPDRRLAIIETQAIQLSETVSTSPVLNAAEVESLRVALPRLVEACRALSEFSVPSTLVHGDLFGNNIACPEGRFLYVDWGQACVSHPFFDAIHLMDMDDIDSAEARDSYLAQWTAYEPMDRLVQAWELAQPLTFLLELMVRYYLGTERGFEPEETGEHISETLQKTLRTLE
jgi:hypothetical protein